VTATTDPPPPPPTAQQPLPVMSYATQPPSNQAAVLSFVFGLLLVIPFVPGVLAIVFGRRGLKVAKEHGVGRAGLARFGIVLGIVNIALSVGMGASLPFALINARRAATSIACASNLRSLGQAMMIYAAANRGLLPPTIDHIAPVVPGAAAARMFACPACAGNAAKPPVVTGTTVSSNYFYAAPAPRLSQIKQGARVVLAYEPPTNHDNRGMNVLFCDGHVEMITGPAMTRIAAELAAGQNPPPSHK
jgi:prepilin-type processing-associated H-X9-DG protein